MTYIIGKIPSWKYSGLKIISNTEKLKFKMKKNLNKKIVFVKIKNCFEIGVGDGQCHFLKNFDHKLKTKKIEKKKWFKKKKKEKKKEHFLKIWLKKGILNYKRKFSKSKKKFKQWKQTFRKHKNSIGRILNHSHQQSSLKIMLKGVFFFFFFLLPLPQNNESEIWTLVTSFETGQPHSIETHSYCYNVREQNNNLCWSIHFCIWVAVQKKRFSLINL